jgi:predicted NBD/HSP70 family sugar kinase
LIQIGVDFGGTKIEAAVLDRDGAFPARLRAPKPGSYAAALITVRDLVVQMEREAGGRGTVGVGAPGSVSPRTGVIRNANSTWLNGRPFREDLEAALERPVSLANDVTEFALRAKVSVRAGAPCPRCGRRPSECGPEPILSPAPGAGMVRSETSSLRVWRNAPGRRRRLG